MKPRRHGARKRKLAHDTPELGPARTKVRPLTRKPDPNGHYETGTTDPDAARKSPWVDEGEAEPGG
jgi:hypothetical protein